MAAVGASKKDELPPSPTRRTRTPVHGVPTKRPPTAATEPHVPTFPDDEGNP